MREVKPLNNIKIFIIKTGINQSRFDDLNKNNLVKT